MSTLSTHVLDTSLGRPAGGLPIRLETGGGASPDAGGWQPVGEGITDDDGRVRDLLGEAKTLSPGLYRITFETAAYFAASGTKGFYPYVQVVFEITAPDEHYHVPLLLSPFGISTYRGS
jgi:5-hydroxyisourate hydrolase